MKDIHTPFDMVSIPELNFIDNDRHFFAKGPWLIDNDHPFFAKGPWLIDNDRQFSGFRDFNKYSNILSLNNFDTTIK